MMLISLLAFNLSTMLRDELEAATGKSWDLDAFSEQFCAPVDV